MIDLFKAEDFHGGELIVPAGSNAFNTMASMANTKLNAYIQCQEKLYGDLRLGSYHGAPVLWDVMQDPRHTFEARIICVKRISSSSPAGQSST